MGVPVFDLREGKETFVFFKISRPTPGSTLPSIEWKNTFLFLSAVKFMTPT
jgi:hypothetical protein